MFFVKKNLILSFALNNNLTSRNKYSDPPEFDIKSDVAKKNYFIHQKNEKKKKIYFVHSLKKFLTPQPSHIKVKWLLHKESSSHRTRPLIISQVPLHFQEVANNATTEIKKKLYELLDHNLSNRATKIIVNCMYSILNSVLMSCSFIFIPL